MDIILKIKEAGLVGRGGASFPTATKWETVKNAPGDKKYVVCNASEGEPGVKKDLFISKNHAERMVDGMKIALDYLGAETGYIYINPSYYNKLARKLNKLIKDTKIILFKKDHRAGYIGGDESALVNHIEGRRIEPRLRPPYIATNGLWNYPTLVNNVETFYNVSLVSAGEYENKRFITIGGDCPNEGVFYFDENWPIEKILRETNNYPKFKFFVQIGGDASGEVLNSSQFNKPVSGAGSITVYSAIKHKPNDLMRKWAYFFFNESCGQCTPCREGTYRLKEALKKKNIDWQLVYDLLGNLEETSFCGLGLVAAVPFKSYFNNVYKAYD
ncbi:MAG: NADH-quinone oxidoreductase subunit 1 [Parcubacteria group bacterium ADurb.Bin316]|nr:MAG: NADH-quinone oxidoreductase subunit 1 [Parcubacteria group bacterium ADurb.Bin316]